MALKRADILAAQDIKFSEIDVPEWGGKVHIRTLSGAERDRYIDMCMRARKPDGTLTAKGLTGALIVAAVCDETGKPLFTAADVEALEGKSAIPLDRIRKAIRRHNRMDEESVKAEAGN